MKVKTVDRFGAPVTRKAKTKMLCQTADPEEKRTIIGDTFMNVHNLLLLWHFLLLVGCAVHILPVYCCCSGCYVALIISYF